MNIIETVDRITKDPYFILEQEGYAPAVACYTGQKPGRRLSCLTCGSIDCEHVAEVVRQSQPPEARWMKAQRAPIDPSVFCD